MMAAKRFARINANAMGLASMTETSEFNNNAVDAKPRGGGAFKVLGKIKTCRLAIPVIAPRKYSKQNKPENSELPSRPPWLGDLSALGHGAAVSFPVRTDMVTPNGIRFRLLQVQADELNRIIAAMKANLPPNATELVGVIREVQAELAAAATALQCDRAAVARAQASTG